MSTIPIQSIRRDAAQFNVMNGAFAPRGSCRGCALPPLLPGARLAQDDSQRFDDLVDTLICALPFVRKIAGRRAAPAPKASWCFEPSRWRCRQLHGRRVTTIAQSAINRRPLWRRLDRVLRNENAGDGLDAWLSFQCNARRCVSAGS